MLVAAAVCPCPPLLVPEVAAGAAPELDAARAACDEAIGAMIAARPELIVVVGQGTRNAHHAAGARGSFRPFGVDLEVTLGTAPAEEWETEAEAELPPSLAVGAWLLARAGWDGPVRGYEVTDDRSWQVNGEDGVHIAGYADRVGLLVMGDGSACRTVKAPGYLDERAEGVDAEIAAALRDLDDEGRFPNLDADLARALKISGRGPWQILLGAWDKEPGTARLLYEDAPYGVGYFVASWT
ncbi:class III extradiol dioxygenase subunit B-like domain-containing protein [Streptomyces sp. NPDC059524]|uniref:class III extradiol dioxygenase subunit B-like domain-containing protein n=1 Tax=Streptomyces sp. NPDC059524 TaxID=3346856 RepID=UPI0036C10A5E